MDVMGGFQLSARTEAICLLVGEMVYAYYFVLLWKRASSRLLALLVLLPPNLLVPWRAPSGIERALYCFALVWIIGTKLLLLAWDRGAASDPAALSSFPRFFSAMVLSLHLKCDHSSTSFSTSPSSTIVRAPTASQNRDSDPNTLSCRKSASRGGGEFEGEKGIIESNSTDESETEVGSGGKEGKSRIGLGASYIGVLVNSQKGQMVLLRALLYFVAGSSIVRTLLAWKPMIPQSVLVLLYTFLMYFMLLFFFEGAAGIPALICGLQLPSQFNMPYLATSLGDFWGRRWNLLVNNLLRASVYEPILQLERRQRKKNDVRDSKPSNAARAVGLFASFLLSGLMHELIFFYLIQKKPTWEMTAFFVTNGIGTLVEMLVMKVGVWSWRFSLPKVVRWGYTLGFVHATGMWLFYPPIDRSGMLDACLVDLGRFIDWVEQTICWSLFGK